MAQLTDWLSFHEKLQEKVGDILDSSGFKLEFSEIGEREETLIYERRSDNSKKVETLQFDGLLWSHISGGMKYEFNWLRVYAASQNSTLVVKSLSKSWGQTLDTFNQGGWIYRNEIELTSTLDELEEILSTQLFLWFDNPSTHSNTA
jgi:hypothetical protein